jgi:hypothetical protein
MCWRNLESDIVKIERRRSVDDFACNVLFERRTDQKAGELCPLIKYLYVSGERLDSEEKHAVTLSSQSVGPIIGVSFPPFTPRLGCFGVESIVVCPNVSSRWKWRTL